MCQREEEKPGALGQLGHTLGARTKPAGSLGAAALGLREDSRNQGCVLATVLRGRVALCRASLQDGAHSGLTEHQAQNSIPQYAINSTVTI